MMRVLLIAIALAGLFLATDSAVLVHEVNAASHQCRYWSGFRTYDVVPWTTAPCRLLTRLGGPYQ